MKTTSLKSQVWLPYLLVALLGYVIGNVSPLVDKMSSIALGSRLLEEAEEVEKISGELGGETEEEEGGFGVSSDQAVTIVTCIVLLLIFLTILFEVSKEHLEESASRNLQPLIEKLFGEMTVLGFLSVVTFCLTKTKVFTLLSEAFFENEEELLEIFEFIHMTLFFVMILFVCQVLILVAQATETEGKWEAMEKAARDPALLEEWDRRTNSFGEGEKSRRRSHFRRIGDFMSLLPLVRNRKSQEREDQVLFKALRDEFLLERSPKHPFSPIEKARRVSTEFNFGRYLAINQGSLLAHVVEVSVLTWILFASLTVVYYIYVILVNESVEILAWSWVAMGWIVYAFNIIFERHLLEVRKMFLRKEVLMSFVGGASETTFLNPLDDDINGSSASNLSTYALPMWTAINICDYQDSRSWFTQKLAGEDPNRQQSIYWLDKKGPKLYLLILQSNMLFLGIYSAMNVLGFFQSMYKLESTPFFVAYSILALIPLLGVLFGKQHLVAILAQVTCMGAYRRPNVIADVMREEKTARVVRAFIVIHKLRRFAASAKTAVFHRDEAKLKRQTFDKFELAEVGKTFDTFDQSGDGHISYEEFESLMTNLGADVTKKSLDHMIAMLDIDGDGQVSKEEFIDWYAEHGHDETLSEHERAHFLFRLFDRDNSGELTIEEFKRKLDALNVGFSVDEVGAIVNELDTDNSGTIGEHEFSTLIERYYPKEFQDEVFRADSSSRNVSRRDGGHH